MSKVYLTPSSSKLGQGLFSRQTDHPGRCRRSVCQRLHGQELVTQKEFIYVESLFRQRDICMSEKIKPHQVILHSDNGSPMKGATMLATLQTLGVMPSFSRPVVSNDNPYSEAMFRTLKYRPDYPKKAFADLAQARNWVTRFVSWYNNEHRHSAIKFVTPAQRHAGRDIELLTARKAVYDAARDANPLRWSGTTRNWTAVKEVLLNPDVSTDEAIPPATNASMFKRAAYRLLTRQLA
jgi:putative transposase